MAPPMFAIVPKLKITDNTKDRIIDQLVIGKNRKPFTRFVRWIMFEPLEGGNSESNLNKSQEKFVNELISIANEVSSYSTVWFEVCYN